MTKATKRKCPECGASVASAASVYRYAESGLPNVVLHGVEQARCARCGHFEVSIPKVVPIHETIAEALVSSPGRLTGDQLRFLRKHLGLSGEQLGKYLHTDRTKISKWERGQDPIGPSSDRLMRLLAAALDRGLRRKLPAVARHLPEIDDLSGESWELHIDTATLTPTFLPLREAA